jgi:hypothetical protein
MNRCFVIQPFDRGPFDKRFDDVLTPAIDDSGLAAYRVDRDPTVTVPIDSIESGIREAAACLVDISTDNPNVWFELGYALACRKPVVLICAASRETRFPFDIQHRHVISYNTDSTSDFSKLQSDVSERLQAAMAKEAKVRSLSQTTLRETEGLEPHEIAALVIIAESDLDPDSFPSASSLKQDMGNAGYTEIATVLAVNALRAKKFVAGTQVQGYNSNDTYTGYHLLDEGTQWLLSNRDKLVLTRSSKTKTRPKAATNDFQDFPETLADEDDDLPF